MRTRLLIAAAALLAVPALAFGETINGNAADQYVAGPVGTEPQDANGTSVGNPGGATLKVGSVNEGGQLNLPTSGRVCVYVFQLPNLGATANPFTTASLSFGIGSTDNNTTATLNADLYGLARRDAVAGVVAADYFLGDLDVTDATLLQDDILTPTTTEGSIITTSEPGSLALASFLNAQYDGGTGADQFVYLRLNVDEAMPTARMGYNAYTANGPEANRPTITYATASAENADFDGDGDVDGADFLTWQQNVATATGATLADGDANGDEAVDGEDLAVWQGNFGAAVAGAQNVPEPGAIALALLAVAAWPGLIRAKVRRKLDTVRTAT